MLAVLVAALTASGALVAACDTVAERAPSDPAPSPGSPHRDAVAASDLFERLNDERRLRGLPPLEWDDELAGLAKEWSTHLASRHRSSPGDLQLEHRDLAEVLASGRIGYVAALGENVFGATGQVPVGAIHLGWMESDGHRSVLLDPGWDRVGIGVVCLPNGATFATQNFGRLHGSERPVPGETDPPPTPIGRATTDGPNCEGTPTYASATVPDGVATLGSR